MMPFGFIWLPFFFLSEPAQIPLRPFSYPNATTQNKGRRLYPTCILGTWCFHVLVSLSSVPLVRQLRHYQPRLFPWQWVQLQMLVMYKVVLDVMGSSGELAGFGLSSSLSSAEILKMKLWKKLVVPLRMYAFFRTVFRFWTAGLPSSLVFQPNKDSLLRPIFLRPITRSSVPLSLLVPCCQFLKGFCS